MGSRRRHRRRRPILVDLDARSIVMAAIPAAVMLTILIVSNVQTGFDAKYFVLGTLACLGIFVLSIIRTKWHVIRWIYTVIFAIGMPTASIYLLQAYTISPIGEKGIYFNMLFVNFAIAGLFFLLTTGLFGSLRNGYRAAIVVIMVIGIINYFVVLFRGTPVMPWDVLSIRTAISVSSGYDYDLNQRFFWCTAGFVGMFILAGKMEGYIWSYFKRFLLVVLVLVATFFGTRWLNKVETKNKIGMDQTLFTPGVCYRNNGLLATFVGNVELMRIGKPEGYSDEKVVKVVNDAPPTASETNATATLPTNVLVIMNEAFSDLSVLGDFETSENPLPTFTALQEECGGKLLVSVKGGNTANTEFEFLTGNSMAFLPTGAIPYQQYVRKTLPSMASQMKDLGYETTALHPYGAHGWNRDEVYPLLGFDRFLSEPDFVGADRLRGYVTDESAFDKLLEIAETEERPQFQFLVTMQNHGGYSHDYEDLFPEVRLESLPTKNKQIEAAEKYLTLTKKSDEAFANLIAKLENFDEPTVVVMFGDHQPSDYITRSIDRAAGNELAEEGDPPKPEEFLVPYVVWNNYGATYDLPDLASVGIFSAYFLREIGVPLTKYEDFLVAIHDDVEGVNPSFLIDASDRFKERKDANEREAKVLTDYATLQYAYMFDPKGKEWAFSYSSE